MKKIISLIFAVLMLAHIVPVAFAEGTDDAVRIDKTYLALGDNLRVENPSGFELKFYIEDEETASDTLTLNEAYLEKWITVKAYNGGDEVGEDRVYFSRRSTTSPERCSFRTTSRQPKRRTTA